MRIDYYTRGVKKDARGYVYQGDLVCNEDLEIFLDEPLSIVGALTVTGNVHSKKSITVARDIKVGGEFEVADGLIRCWRSITTGSSLKATQSITADQGIETGASIMAGGKVKTAHENLVAKRNIYADGGAIWAEGHVTAKHGAIRSSSNVTAQNGDVFANENIEAPRGGISASGNITAKRGFISCGRNMVAGRTIEAAGSIHCAKGIESGCNIVADSIHAGWGLKAGESITARTYIYGGKRIFAGLYLFHSDEEAQKTIQCAELRSGQICYGDLVIKEPEDMEG